jgi:hypothetical protein
MARADVTPPVGIYHRMWGAAKHDRSLGVHRPLLATAMILQKIDAKKDAKQYQIIVTLDHCLLGAGEVESLLKAIERTSGLDRNAVTITYSHTHAAGLMLLDRAELPGGDLIPEYLERLNSAVAILVTKCRDDLRRATITYGSGRCNLAAQRDFWDAENNQYVCGFNPDGEADDTVVVARVTTANDELVATIVNYACHPTTLAWDNQLISPDYPGAMREVVEQATGAPCVFIQGASGDLGPRVGFVGETEAADRNGRQLGYAALAAFETLPPPNTRFKYMGPVVSGATIGTWADEPLSADRLEELSLWQVKRKNLPLQYRSDLPSIEQLKQEQTQWQADEHAARANGDEQRASECRAMVERRTRMLARLEALPDGESFPYQVVVLRTGNAVWVSVQGEPYNLLQRKLRERFSETPIVVASLSNHWGCAYLPPANMYGKGIYQESVAVLAPNCLEQLISELGDMIAEVLGRQ